jgi:hypothetical protein
LATLRVFEVEKTAENSRTRHISQPALQCLQNLPTENPAMPVSLHRPQPNLLTDLLQLSPAELRLAALPARLLNPQACAECLGALLRTTSTSRQAGLISLIDRLRR